MGSKPIRFGEGRSFLRFHRRGKSRQGHDGRAQERHDCESRERFDHLGLPTLVDLPYNRPGDHKFRRKGQTRGGRLDCCMPIYFI